jgi:hypothetical protein
MEDEILLMSLGDREDEDGGRFRARRPAVIWKRTKLSVGKPRGQTPGEIGVFIQYAKGLHQADRLHALAYTGESEDSPFFTL